MTRTTGTSAVALLADNDERHTIKTRDALRKLQGIVSLIDLASVAQDLNELAGALVNAQIVLLPQSAATVYPELLTWIRSLRPLADIWWISPEKRPVDNLTDTTTGASTDASTGIDSADEVLGMELFNAARIKPLRERLERRLRQKTLLQQMGIVSRSPRMGLIAETIDRIAPTEASVLIVGPSGSGKELIARALHNHSRRKDKPFVALNCGAIPEGLIESELFGHKKGAFTGSVGARSGYFSQADGGTIFLDEIGEMKADMQVKLLRALEEGAFYPLGSDRPQSVDVRAVSATNRELESEIASGRFREDLYYRLSAIKITVPSLSERPEDIIPLLAAFSAGSQLEGFSESALKALEQYYWPGNVRQLKNFVTRISALTGDGEVSASDVESYIAEQQSSAPTLPVVSHQPQEQIGMELVYQALMQLGSEVKGLRELIVANLPNQDKRPVIQGSHRSVSQSLSARDSLRMLSLSIKWKPA